MEIIGNGVFQKCSGTLNLNLAPAFRSEHNHIALHSDNIKALNKNEAGVTCSLVLTNVARQRDTTQVSSSGRRRQQEKAGG